MKKILIVMSIALTTFFAHAQQIRLEETPLNWPVMLSNLNQSAIKAGFLYNKSAMFTNLNNFNIGNYNANYIDRLNYKIVNLVQTDNQPIYIKAIDDS